jgi:Protein of unknown function (DUF2851)
MKESLLHYVWQHRLFYTDSLCTTDGQSIEVIDVGKYNTDAGPDFFNAKVRIGNTIWAGNIEIHTSSSDWEKHSHHHNKAYDNVILHVVEKADKVVCRMDGAVIPQLELKFSDVISRNYQHLLSNQQWVACAHKIELVPPIFIQSWKNALLSERLEQKTNAINQLLDESNNHWEDAFYKTLARNFGFGTNSQAFEMLAKSLPLTALAKYKDDLVAIEAMLFGQAGLLMANPVDEYSERLISEYEFFKSKFSLKPIDGSQWKLLRLRPDNFPHVRIAQFASLIHGSSKLFSKIVENPDLTYLSQIFKSEPSTYWDTHYHFGATTKLKSKKLGAQSIHLLIINTVVPFLFCYSIKKNDERLKERALQLLEQLPAEKNGIITNWSALNIVSDSAADSQALLQLKNEYCENKKCLRCRIGHKLLTLPIN